jgi:hypothetical protein
MIQGRDTHCNTAHRYGDAWSDNDIFSLERIVTRMTSSKKLILGWLRLFLGVVQMLFATACVGLLLTVGLHWTTWMFFAGAAAATIISRIVYRGHVDPDLEEKNAMEKTC